MLDAVPETFGQTASTDQSLAAGGSTHFADLLIGGQQAETISAFDGSETSFEVEGFAADGRLPLSDQSLQVFRADKIQTADLGSGQFSLPDSAVHPAARYAQQSGSVFDLQLIRAVIL